MAGGAGGAAGIGGAPVLQGLGRGSATGVPFPSLIWFGARVAESSRSEPQGMRCFFGSVFLALGPVFEALVVSGTHCAPCARGARGGPWPDVEVPARTVI